MAATATRVARGVRRRVGRIGGAAVGRLGAPSERLGVDDAVALTFDDGPHPEHTPALLEALARLDLVATFFLVGDRAAEHPDLVRRIVSEGHGLGSHSATHPDPWTLRLSALVREYRQGRRTLEQIVGGQVRLFRPPKGYWDLRGALACRVAGLDPWRWTIDTHDWEAGASARSIIDAFGEIRAGDVVLLHDAIERPVAPETLDRRATVAALDEVSALLRRRGLRTVILTER